MMAENDANTKVIVLYVEPGGVYEEQAVKMMREKKYKKPIVVYVAGSIAEKYSISLGHAGAVVEGKFTSATGKMEVFDNYFGVEPFSPNKKYEMTPELKNSLVKISIKYKCYFCGYEKTEPLR
jgi:succinyl-CoA synthetase alpha subunit